MILNAYFVIDAFVETSTLPKQFEQNGYEQIEDYRVSTRRVVMGPTIRIAFHWCAIRDPVLGEMKAARARTSSNGPSISFNVPIMM